MLCRDSSFLSAIGIFFLISDKKSLFLARSKQNFAELFTLNAHLQFGMHAWKCGLGETMKASSGESETFILAIVQGDLFASLCGFALVLTTDMLEKLEAVKSQDTAECLRI